MRLGVRRMLKRHIRAFDPLLHGPFQYADSIQPSTHTVRCNITRLSSRDGSIVSFDLLNDHRRSEVGASPIIESRSSYGHRLTIVEPTASVAYDVLQGSRSCLV